jgi:hypothetical protein
VPRGISHLIDLKTFITGREMRKHSSPVGDELVFKIGRTTGPTAGFINSIRRITLQGWQPGDDGIPEYDIGQAWIVASTTRGSVRQSDRVFHPPFCDRGDSGSAIFNQSGEFKGLLIGGTTDRIVDDNFFISADDLFEDIKEFTGADEVKLIESELFSPEE